MAQIKIYASVENATIFFEGSTIQPKELKTVAAVAHPTVANRVIIQSTILKDKNDNTLPRVFLKKLSIGRIQNQNGEDLVGTLGYDRAQVLDYLNGEFNKVLVQSVAASYKGTWNATTNLPDLDSTGSINNGDWYWVVATGSYDGDEYLINDQVRFNSGSQEWERIPDSYAKMTQIEETALGHYDIYVDPAYNGIQQGSNILPYKYIQTAVDNSSNGDSIFIKGENIVTSSIILPDDKMLHFYGDEESKIKYSTFNQSNGDIIFKNSGSSMMGYQFDGLQFENAGGSAIHIKESDHIYIQNCKFKNNGWDGTGIILDGTGSNGLPGTDSTLSTLQTFGAGANITADGSAVEILSTKGVRLHNNHFDFNNNAIVVGNSGTDEIEITSNFINKNTGTGISLTHGHNDFNGCQNSYVINNIIRYCGDEGIEIKTGIDNVIGDNVIKGNWNAGILLEDAANVRVSNANLVDNNRTQYSAKGDETYSKATVQLRNQGNMPEAYTYIAEFSDLRITNSSLSNKAGKIGFYIDSEIGNLSKRECNLIEIDNVGFRGQETAVDISDVDLTNIRLVFGNSTVLDNVSNAVKIPSGSGINSYYYELPYSNHINYVPSLDVSLDTPLKTVILREKLANGNLGQVVNTYPVNTLKALFQDGRVFIILKDSKKIQLDDIVKEQLSINGNPVVGDNNTVVNQLNSTFENLNVGAGSDFTLVTPTIISGSSNVTGSTSTSTEGNNIIAQQPNGNNHGAVFALDVIDEPGEYYQFSISSSNLAFGIGLAHTDQTSSIGDTSGDINTGVYWGGTFGTNNGPNSPIGVSGSATALAGWNDTPGYQFASQHPSQSITYRVGFDEDGYSYLSYLAVTGSNSGSFVKILKSFTPILDEQPETDNFHLVWKGITSGSTFIKPIIYAANTGSVIGGLTYHAIESPDEKWYYPMFTTPQEADVYNEYVSDPSVGAGNYDIFTFAVDPTGTIYYIPSGSTPAATTGSNNHPLSSSDYPGVEWNFVEQGDDSAYTPASFTEVTASVYEYSNINLQVHPADATFTTTVSTLPAGLTLVGDYIQGTAPEVTGSYLTASVDYPVTVTRTNTYGVSTGNLLFRVLNSATPAFNNPSGSWLTGSVPMIDEDTLAEGSVVKFDTALVGLGQRLYIPNTWVENVVVPALSASYALGDTDGKIVVGIPDVQYSDSYPYINSGSYTNDPDQNIAGELSLYHEFKIVNGNWRHNIKNGTGHTILSGSDGVTVNGLTNVGFGSYTNDFGFDVVTDRLSAIAQANTSQVRYHEASTLANGFNPSWERSLTDTVDANNTPLNALVWCDISGGMDLSFDGWYIKDIPSSVQAYSGSTHITSSAPLIDQDTLQSGSAVELQDTLVDGERLVVSASWLTSVGYPSVQNEGATTTAYYIGIPSSSADFSITNGVQDNDFTDFFKITPKAGDSSKFRLEGFVGSIGFMDIEGSYSSPAPYSLIFDNRNGLVSLAASSQSYATFFDDESLIDGGSWQYANTGSFTGTLDVTFAAKGAEMDFTSSGLTQVNLPATASSTPAATAGNYAVNFDANGGTAKMQSNSFRKMPLKMNGLATAVGIGSLGAGYTSDVGNARPWSTTIVFKPDWGGVYGNPSSTQYIWNLGEGDNTGDVNMYLRLDSNNRPYFGWGAVGSNINECQIANVALTNSSWYAITISHNGARFTANDATPANLAAAFDIRMGASGNGSIGAGLFTGGYNTNRSIVATASDHHGWGYGGQHIYNPSKYTGNDMTHAINGDLKIGAQDYLGYFDGSISHLIMTTLRTGVAMPSISEIVHMWRVPHQWLADFKEGQPLRECDSFSDAAQNFITDSGFYQNTAPKSYNHTQLWTFGDGANDSYPNIENTVRNDSGDTRLIMSFMSANDIETVTVPGVT